METGSGRVSTQAKHKPEYAVIVNSWREPGKCGMAAILPALIGIRKTNTNAETHSFSHSIRMLLLFIVKEDKTPNPGNICLLDTTAVMFESDLDSSQP